MTPSSGPVWHAETSPGTPVRVLVLRGVDGSGGGADKIILRNAAQVDPEQVQMTLCFMRHREDRDFDFDRRCAAQDLRYREVLHRGAADRTVLPQLKGLVHKLRPQVIHSHDYKANFYATLLARGGGPLRLATSHGWTGNARRERMVYYPADKLLLSRFPGVIAVSDPIRQTLIRWGAKPDRVRVLLNGVDPEAYQSDSQVRQQVRQQLGLAAGDLVLGAVGRVEQQKRFDVLLDGLVLLRQHQPQAKLIVAGDGSLLPWLRERVTRKQLTQCVQLLGHCANMRELYQAFDVFVQSSDYEGTPTVVVEAMAMQVPVVATDVGGTRQLMMDQQHGLLVPPRRPDRLAEAIQETISDPLATRRRVTAARERVATVLSFRQRVEKLQQIYRDLVVHGSLEPRASVAVASGCGSRNNPL